MLTQRTEKDRSRLAGKVAIVTGAASGIGEAIVASFEAEGATVIGVDIRHGLAPASGSLIADVQKEDDWDRVVRTLLSDAHRIDILVNNAGIIDYSTVLEQTEESWDRVVGVDQTGTFLGMRAVLPVMVAQGCGSIINLSSGWGVIGGRNAHAYHAAKGGIRGLTRAAAVAYGGQGIRVNTVIPGLIRTPLTERQDPALNERITAGLPMGQGLPSDIAHGCVFLASDDARYVNGSELVIDGGGLAR